MVIYDTPEYTVGTRDRALLNGSDWPTPCLRIEHNTYITGITYHTSRLPLPFTVRQERPLVSPFLPFISFPPLQFLLFLSLLLSHFISYLRSSIFVSPPVRLVSSIGLTFVSSFFFYYLSGLSSPLPSFLFIPVAFFSAWCCLILIFFIIFSSLFLLSQQGVYFHLKQSQVRQVVVLDRDCSGTAVFISFHSFSP